LDILHNINIQMYLLAYFLGSIPFGLIYTKIFAGIDVRRSGSGNIGATNVLRVLKQKNPILAKKISALTLISDALKGVVALLIGKYLGVCDATLWGMAVLAVIGHCFSIFLLFEGGKGVATGLGVLLFMIPKATLVGVILWFVSAKLFKISSLASLIGVLGVYVSSFYFYPQLPHAPITIIVFIIFYKHTDNIVKLIKGEEKRVV